MPSYPSIYRAKAVKFEAPVLTAFVPQVFGDVSIEVTDFLDDPVAGMGWVFFQGGNPEFPVWTTRVVSGTPPTLPELDDRYVNKNGDTMTGDLQLRAADPVGTYAAVNADYMHRWINLGDSTRIAKAGDAMTGFLTLHANPSAGLHAATRQYVDGLAAPTAWTALPLNAPWVAEDSGFMAPAYRKIGDLVYVRGSAMLASTSFVLASFGPLPAGFRPLAPMRLMIGAHKRNAGGAYSARGQITTAGVIEISEYSPTDKATPVIYLGDIPPFSVI